MTKTRRQQHNPKGYQAKAEVTSRRVLKGVRALLRKGWSVLLSALRWLGARHEWAMVLVTIGLFVYAKEQSLIAAKQAGISDRQAALMVAAQRAWVGPIDSIKTDPVKVGLPFTVSVTLKNAGHAPALQVENSGQTVVLRKGKLFDPYAYTLPDPFSRAVLLPGDTLRMGYENPEHRVVVQGDLDSINNGDNVVYLIGEITYYDTLDRRQHHTRFSRVLVPGQKASYWTVTKTGNDMD